MKACEIDNGEKCFFKLFIAGHAYKNKKIIENLRNMFDSHLKCYDLKVINILMNPELAERDNIIATPAIVKNHHSWPLMVIGDMSNWESVLSGLNLIKKVEQSQVLVK